MKRKRYQLLATVLGAVLLLGGLAGAEQLAVDPTAASTLVAPADAKQLAVDPSGVSAVLTPADAEQRTLNPTASSEPFERADAVPPPAPAETFPTLISKSQGTDTNAYADQHFDAAYATFDIFVADNFTVPTGHTWTIQQITWHGNGWNGYTGMANSSAFDCYVFNDASGEPAGIPIYNEGTPVFHESWAPSAPNVTIIETPPPPGSPYPFGESSVQAEPTAPPAVTAGTYWVSCFPTLSFSAGYGQWGSYVSDVTTGVHGMAANPGGGFSYATGWADMSEYGTTGTGWMFTLSGIDSTDDDDDNDDNDNDNDDNDDNDDDDTAVIDDDNDTADDDNDDNDNDDNDTSDDDDDDNDDDDNDTSVIDDDNDTPDDDDDTSPSDDDASPSDDDASPSDDDASPSDDDTSPSDDDLSPSDDDTSPVVDDDTSPGPTSGKSSSGGCGC